jgi:isopenicillin N synthase-like dioxygenase
VINIAEVMTAMTNGRFASARHRVINAYGVDRYSVPFFVNPDYDTVVAPLPQFVDRDHPAAFQPYRAGDVLHTLFRNLWPGAGQVDSAA